MTLRCVAAFKSNRDNLSAEISANVGQPKGASIVPTGHLATVAPAGYGTPIIPTG